MLALSALQDFFSGIRELLAMCLHKSLMTQKEEKLQLVCCANSPGGNLRPELVTRNTVWRSKYILLYQHTVFDVCCYTRLLDPKIYNIDCNLSKA